jgi:hypothetical protein
MTRTKQADRKIIASREKAPDDAGALTPGFELN